MPFENIKEIYRRISHAAMRRERCPSEVKLIAVSKTVPADLVIRAVEIGLREFGESRVQEAKEKILSVTARMKDSRLVWHLIGHLQKNKAKAAVELFDLIHSVDSFELGETLDRQAGKIGKTQRVLVEVKLSEEESKYGISDDALLPVLRRLDALKHLKVEGLMTIPPYCEDAEMARPYFRRLRQLREEAQKEGFGLPELSMGMSNDFEVAVEEGATMVRVGTAIFGERKKETL